ncbi:hypothetical protein ANCCAN_08352 [Ancylostoma caninum]|uniref:Secreted protein n=1 Tax=Ancylostoma caninum TaxID=29170 RepID=A0A368GMQ5_ANCCA|nr:hypothetical protein ANCCAN_08352 [Ancylostoma caninum]
MFVTALVLFLFEATYAYTIGTGALPGGCATCEVQVGVWSEWSEWTPCSMLMGGGLLILCHSHASAPVRPYLVLVDRLVNLDPALRCTTHSHRHNLTGVNGVHGVDAARLAVVVRRSAPEYVSMFAQAANVSDQQRRFKAVTCSHAVFGARYAFTHSVNQ